MVSRRFLGLLRRRRFLVQNFSFFFASHSDKVTNIAFFFNGIGKQPKTFQLMQIFFSFPLLI